MNHNQIETKSILIKLSNKTPVKIQENEWPIIAHGNYKDYDNQFRFQANRATDLYVKVRQHIDGRAIIYGRFHYSTNFQNERDNSQYAGYVIDAGDDIIETIQRVGRNLIERLVDPCLVRDVINQCIEDLPAERL